MTKQEFIHCSLCGGIVKDSESHNAEPLCEGRCCSKCTAERVLPERLKDIFGVRSNHEGSFISVTRTEYGADCKMEGSGEELLMMAGCVLDSIAKNMGEEALFLLLANTIKRIEGKTDHV